MAIGSRESIDISGIIAVIVLGVFNVGRRVFISLGYGSPAALALSVGCMAADAMIRSQPRHFRDRFRDRPTLPFQHAPHPSCNLVGPRPLLHFQIDSDFRNSDEN